MKKVIRGNVTEEMATDNVDQPKKIWEVDMQAQLYYFLVQ